MVGSGLEVNRGKRHAVFRADAGVDLGGGHVHRCLSLAAALTERGWSCTFVSVRGSGDVIPGLREGRHRLVEIEVADRASIAPVAQAGPADLMVIDHYHLHDDFETMARACADRIMVIDDFPVRSHDCDVLLDQTLGHLPNSYRRLMRSTDAHVLTGPGFALLRRDFAVARPAALARERDGVNRVLVSFGASDARGFALPAADAACEAGIGHVDIAAGAACPHLDALREFVATHPQVRLHVDADMVPLLAAADLAIGAAGGSAWERCCLGVPALLAIVADNQRDVGRALHDAGAAWLVDLIGQSPSSACFARILNEIIKDPAGLAAKAKAAARQCDGLGAGRVAAILSANNHAFATRIVLRPAAMEDVSALYDMQATPGTRRYFRDPRVPTFEEHRRWFEHRLEDPRSLLSMICAGDRIVGSLRLDRLESEDEQCRYEISIIIDPKHKSRGFGSAALHLAQLQFSDAVLVAWIRDENRPSIGLFTKSGFLPCGDGWYTWSAADAAVKPSGRVSG